MGGGRLREVSLIAIKTDGGTNGGRLREVGSLSEVSVYLWGK